MPRRSLLSIIDVCSLLRLLMSFLRHFDDADALRRYCRFFFFIVYYVYYERDDAMFVTMILRALRALRCRARA